MKGGRKKGKRTLEDKKESTPQDGVPPCPYCARPEIFEPRGPTPGAFALALGAGAGAYLTGKYWQRGEGRYRSFRSFPTVDFKDGERRFWISGRKNFTPPYQGFDVEVIGLEFKFRPMQSAGPGFYQSITYKPGVKDFDGERDIEKVFSYNACRITHRATGIVADAHAWESHGLLVTVKNLPQNPTGPAIKAASTLLIFFSLDYRGKPKITRQLIMDAFKKRGGDATQAAVARELRVTERALQKWAEREGIEGWEEMRGQFAPRPPLAGREQDA